MKSGVTLQQMLTEVKRQSESKEDYLIAPNRLRMESYGKEMFLHLSDDSGTELIEPMTITGIAHRQIGTHLRIPAAYYDRMREERPDLLAYNANTWFKQESSQRMLRTLDGSARAYLSNRYRRIDNIDIAGVTLPILGGLPDIRFESCQITESRMYIKAVNPRLQAEVSPGDIVQAGIIDTAIDLMRRKHKKGEFYYWILYYAYLSPQQCENAGAILQLLETKGISISLRTYYVHRDEAIEVLSSILWGYTSQDCEKITNLLTPD